MKKILLLSDSHGYMGEEILKHIHKLEENNIKEIILSGINVGDFGVENNDPTN